METQRLIELASNAKVNHWPPHLGLNSDAERIEYLATQLDEAATRIVNAEILAEQNEALREERDDALNRACDLREKLDKIHGLSTPPRG